MISSSICKRLFLVILFVVIALLNPVTRLFPNSVAQVKKESADDTAKYVIQALKANDWKAFTKVCTNKIIVSHYTRIYTNDWNKHQLQMLFPDNLGLEGDYQSGHYSVIQTQWQTSKALTSKQNAIFNKFCKSVREALDRNKNAFHIDENSSSSEVEEWFEPAMRGDVASNFEVSVNFRKINGRWRITELTLATHF